MQILKKFFTNCDKYILSSTSSFHSIIYRQKKQDGIIKKGAKNKKKVITVMHDYSLTFFRQQAVL